MGACGYMLENFSTRQEGGTKVLKIDSCGYVSEILIRDYPIGTRRFSIRNHSFYTIFKKLNPKP